MRGRGDRPVKKLFVLGDSISIHYGPYLERWLEGRFAYDRKGRADADGPGLDCESRVNGGDSANCLAYFAGRDDLRCESFRRYGEDVLLYNGIAEKAMAESGVPAIDLFAFTSKLGGREIYEDHVHFTQPVRQLQAAFIAGWLIGNMT